MKLEHKTIENPRVVLSDPDGRRLYRAVVQMVSSGDAISAEYKDIAEDGSGSVSAVMAAPFSYVTFSVDIL